MKNLKKNTYFRNLLITLGTLLCAPALLVGESLLTWKDLQGGTFEAKIVSVGAQSVKLQNSEGTQVDFPLGDLMPSSRAQVDAWSAQHRLAAAAAAAAAEPEYKESVFDSVVVGNLERLRGSRLARCTDATRPEKYYVFYYTASWCPPCRRFTPTLVEWYKENKNKNFELVLISSDRTAEAMESYASDAKMPWPQLRMDKVRDFRRQFDHGVRGIPALIVTDLEGKVLGNYRGNLAQLAEMVK